MAKTKSAIQKAEDARRKRQKDKMKKNAAKEHYSSVEGYKGKAGGMNIKSKSYKEKRADAQRADVRDAAKSGQTMVQLKLSGKLSNVKQDLNKVKKELERILRGRK
tara:strand:+ start:249 stop:566 length:318 start_codon:yes stop_codon:yes gene_type:complete